MLEPNITLPPKPSSVALSRALLRMAIALAFNQDCKGETVQMVLICPRSWLPRYSSYSPGYGIRVGEQPIAFIIKRQIVDLRQNVVHIVAFQKYTEGGRCRAVRSRIRHLHGNCPLVLFQYP